MIERQKQDLQNARSLLAEVSNAFFSGDSEGEATEVARLYRGNKLAAEVVMAIGEKKVRDAIKDADESIQANEVGELVPFPESVIVTTGTLRPSLLVNADGTFQVAPEGPFQHQVPEWHRMLTPRLLGVGKVEIVGRDTKLRSDVGTAWMLTNSVAVTNRHVAEYFAYPVRRGRGRTEFLPSELTDSGRIEASVNFHAFHDAKKPPHRVDVRAVVMQRLGPDVALLLLAEEHDHALPIDENVTGGQTIAVLGYPADDPYQPRELVARLFGDQFGKKRLAPGFVKGVTAQVVKHDASTLGGNSGSPVVDVETGRVVGLHYGGQINANYAVNMATFRPAVDHLMAVLTGTDSVPAAIRAAPDAAVPESSRPPVPSSWEIRTRAELIYALSEAAELEHILMVQYLFAAFSFKRHPSEFEGPRGPVQFEMARRWKAELIGVAREEMQHLAMVLNMLVAVGGAPQLHHANFPSRSAYFRGDVSASLMALQPFGYEALQRFRRFEWPRDVPLPMEELARVQPPALQYGSVGELYDAIRNGFRQLVADHGGDESKVLINTDGQVNLVDRGLASRFRQGVEYRFRYETLADVEKGIDAIVLEGEGAPTVREGSHFATFTSIAEELSKELTADPSFSPSRRVSSNPALRAHRDTASFMDPTNRWPDHAEFVHVPVNQADIAYLAMDTFQGAYLLMCAMLARFFNGSASAEEQKRRSFVQEYAFWPFMTEVIRPLGEALTAIRLTPQGDWMAGASFETLPSMMLAEDWMSWCVMVTECFEVTTRSCKETLAQLRIHGFPETVQADFKSVLESLEILSARFGVESGVRPAPARGPDFRISERFQEPSGPHLQLSFRGWFQCRLATDPETHGERWGVSGTTFAVHGEPELDRIVRFQAEGAVARSHCPAPGVVVTVAVIRAGASNEESVPGFEGARVSLLDDPVFEGRNYIITSPSEPLDPFHLSINTDTGGMSRRCVGVPLKELTQTELKETGRMMSALKLEEGNYKDVLGKESWKEFVEERKGKLQQELDALRDDDPGSWGLRSALKKRLEEMEKYSRGIRQRRLLFFVHYEHAISGDLHVNGTVALPGGWEIEKAKSWQVSYDLRCYDSDAMSAYCEGTVHIPVARIAGRVSTT